MDVRGLFALSMLCAAAPALAQDVVAGQSPASPAPSAISTDEAGGAFAHDNQRLAEIVSVPRDAAIDRIRFWGGSETDAQDDQNTMGFRVRIYERVAGALTLRHDRKVGRGFARPADAQATFGADGAKMFRYELDVSRDPIALTGGKEYAVSVAAIHFVPPRTGRESWNWAGAAGDGVVLVDLFDGLGLMPGSAGVAGLAIELVGEMAPASCIADVNGDGLLTPADFGAWVAAFNTRDPRADQNGDGLVTPADFGAWVTNFNAGC